MVEWGITVTEKECKYGCPIDRSQPSSGATREKMGPHSITAVYKAKTPPSATPAMAITAVRNGSCSMEAVASEDPEVEAGEDDDGARAE